MEIVGELLSFIIYHWIGYTPRLERDERLSLAVEAKERHDRFLNLFARKLSTGELSLAAVLGKVGGESERIDTDSKAAVAEGNKGESG